mmetsp:Transcript_23631/g.26305  ORF Transcript_23631/g.26305 Transcript_23631/m.26305 type:complete len:530 (-) Transcript_23631:1327-2916(-)
MLRFLRRRVSSDGESSCASSEHTHNLQPKDCNSISNNDNDPATPVSAKETRTSKSNCVPSTPISVTKTREMHSMRLKEVVTKTLLNKVEGLKTFETCIDTSDVLASTSTSSGNPVDNATGLVDCSVLVSADGELLIIPQQQLGKEEQEKQRRDFGKNQSNESEAEEAIDRAELGEEYNSAVFLGNDLHYHGDKRINGFSSKGWSTPAASLALKQSADAMGCLAEFVEDLVLTKKSGAAQENQMADKMHRIIGMKTSVLDESKVVDYQQYMQDNFSPEVNQWEKKRYNIRNKFRSQHQQLKPRTQSVILDKIVTPDRVGPLNRPGGTIPATLVALENYYSSNAESESKLWRAVTQQQGALTKLRNSTIKTEERVRNRQLASQETMRRIKVMEDYLRECKEHAMKKWDEVHVTEKKITQLLEERMMEQSRIREKERLETIKHDQVKLEKSALYENPGPTSSEILDIVSAATASMEEGSFELIDLPHSPLSISANEDAKLACVTPKTNEIPSDLLSDSRYEIEVELSLPEFD